MERTPRHEIRVHAEGHRRRGRRLAVDDGELGDHALGRRQLVSAAERHENRAAADGRVKALGKPLLTADIEIAHIFQHRRRKILTACPDLRRHLAQVALRLARLPDRNPDMLLHAVRVEKGTVHRDDGLAAPLHDEPRLCRHLCDRRCLKVLLLCRRAEDFDVLLVEDDRHALLRFGYGKLCAVKTGILLFHSVQVDDETVGKLADGDSDAARAEVVAALDPAGNARRAEETLNLALGRRIALLHLGAAARKRLFRMLLGGTRRTAAAITPGAPADEDDDISRRRLCADDIFLRCRRDDRTDLHALCHVALMVDLAHLPRRKPDLVAIGAVAGCGAERDLLLRELAGKRVLDGAARIGRARHAHRLIDVGTAGKRIADRTAETGRRAAERLDLRRMVVRLVLEHDEPVFLLPVHVCLDDDAACIDLIALVEVFELSFPAKCLHAHDGDIHQCHIACFIGVNRLAVGEVLPIRFFKAGRKMPAFDFDAVDRRHKRRVAAMIRPIRIDDAQLRDRRGAPFRIAEIGLTEGEVFQTHRKTIRRMEGSELFSRQAIKGIEHFDIRRLIGEKGEGIRFFKRCLTAFDRVDNVALNLIKERIIDMADEDVDERRANLRPLLCRDELDALRRTVCPLVKLTGQILHRKDAGIGEIRQFLLIDAVSRRLCKDGVLRLFIFLIGETFDIIARDNAHCLQISKAERLDEIVKKLLRCNIKSSLSFFYINSAYGHEMPP